MVSTIRYTMFWLLLAGFLAPCSLRSQAVAPTRTDLMERRDDGARLWISVDRAQRDGAIDWSMFDGLEREELEKQIRLDREAVEKLNISRSTLKSQEDGYLPEELCGAATIIFDHFEDPVPRDTLDDLQRFSVAIYETRIVEIQQGFFGGYPASLLTLELISILRSDERYDTESVLYVVYPYAAFTIAGDAFCRIDPRYPYRPAVGDRALVFPSRGPMDSESRLIVPEPEELIAFQGEEQRVVAGGRVAKDPRIQSLEAETLKRWLFAEEEHGGDGVK